LDLNKKSNKQQVLISCFHHWTELQGVELDGEPAAVCSQHRQHEGLPLLLVHTHSFPVRSELGQAPLIDRGSGGGGGAHVSLAGGGTGALGTLC